MVTDSVPDGMEPVARTEVLASGPVAVGIVAVFTVAVAPENTAFAL
jgi:hypothetical protein